MVDAQSVDPPARGQVERQSLRGLEHRAALDAQGRQFVDVEEAPVVDLVGRDAPVREPLGLRLEQRDAARRARGPLSVATARRSRAPRRGRVAHGARASCALEQFLVACALGDGGRRPVHASPAGGARPWRARGERRRPHASPAEAGAGAASRSGGCISGRRAGSGARSSAAPKLPRSASTTAAAARRARAPSPYGSPSTGSSTLPARRGVERLPVDVEVPRIARGHAVLEHVDPPRVVGAEHAHVVGHEVDQQAEAVRARARRRSARRPSAPPSSGLISSWATTS